jgi:membrane-associated phospholipid phosphatase
VPIAIVRHTTVLTIAYLSATVLLIAVCGRAIQGWPWIVGIHLIVSLALLAALRAHRLPLVAITILEWHPLALLPFAYKETERLAAVIGDWRLTAVIPAIEATLFHGQPAIYLSEQFRLVPLSEFLHFCYLAYLLLLPGLAAYWYVASRRDAFHELMWRLATVMFGSYLFLILFPVDSPFYRFEPLGPPLSGHFFFDLVHEVSARGGARGGAFPSAHVSGAVVAWLVAWRHQRRLAVWLTPVVLGLMVATVYGRFHYAVDVVAGVGVAGASWALDTRRFARQ